MGKAPPSKKKLKKAQEEGKTNKSRVLTKAIVALGVLLPITLIIPSVWVRNRILLEYLVVEGAKDPGGSLVLIGRCFLTLTGASLLVGALISVFAEWVQIGLHVFPGRVALQLSRINPVTGFSRMFSGLSQMWLVPLKLLIIVAAIGVVLVRELSAMSTRLFVAGSDSGFEWIQGVFLRVVGTGCIAILVIGVLEYCLNRHRLMKELSMSPDEIRREQREDEGDPHIKSHRRAYHQSLSMQAIVQRIRKAKVIVVEKM